MRRAVDVRGGVKDLFELIWDTEGRVWSETCSPERMVRPLSEVEATERASD